MYIEDFVSFLIKAFLFQNLPSFLKCRVDTILTLPKVSLHTYFTVRFMLFLCAVTAFEWCNAILLF